MISLLYGKFLAPIIFRRKLAKLGGRPRFSGWVAISGAENVEIGDDFFTGPNFYISTSRYAKVNIGDAVMFGPDVMILGGNHDYSYAKNHMRFNNDDDENAKSISIESGVWIGARSVILSGAQIGEGSVVGACSVVKQVVPPYCIAAGNRLQIIKSRFSVRADLEECLQKTRSKYSVEDVLQIYQTFAVNSSLS